MKFSLCFYCFLVFFNVVIFVHSQSQPICITSEKAKKLNDRLIKDHNRLRSRHGVPPLKPDSDMIEGSIDWSKELVGKGAMEHSHGEGYGENIYMNSQTNTIHESELDPVQLWYDEIKLYHGQGFSLETGHYTQVVWKNTRKVGCGVCSGSTGTFLTCRYVPPGNYEGQFEENVLPPKSDPDQDETDTSTSTDENEDITPTSGNTEFPNEDDDNDDDDIITTEFLLFITISIILVLSLIALFVVFLILFKNFINYYHT